MFKKKYLSLFFVAFLFLCFHLFFSCRKCLLFLGSSSSFNVLISHHHQSFFMLYSVSVSLSLCVSLFLSIVLISHHHQSFFMLYSVSVTLSRYVSLFQSISFFSLYFTCLFFTSLYVCLSDFCFSVSCFCSKSLGLGLFIPLFISLSYKLFRFFPLFSASLVFHNAESATLPFSNL